MAGAERPGAKAVRDKGWWRAHRWLLARRISQFGILLLFLLGPWFGVWLVKGNLSSSLFLDVLPLTDPYLALQILFAGHGLEMAAISGALIVLVFYLLVGGRVYCSWVCPMNLVTDAAHWLRERMGIRGSSRISRHARYWLLAMTLVLAAGTGVLAWESLNPVSILHRGLIFGMGIGWSLVAGVFMLDLFVGRRAWCGHLCPVGAFYSLLGTVAPLRVRADQRARCDDCMDCYAVCPEPQVIRPALKGEGAGIGPVILSGNCTNCGRCIDVCAQEVFSFGMRLPRNASPRSSTSLSSQTEVLP
jgi:ferredoxin-type protein NapH